MVFIVENMKFDTEKAEKILDFKRTHKFESFIGTLSLWRDAELYKTKKDNWFVVIKGDNDKRTVTKETEESVKQIFRDLNKADLYSKHFEELEEA